MKKKDYRKRGLGGEFFVASHFCYSDFEVLMTNESTISDLIITGHEHYEMIHPIRIEVKTTSYKWCEEQSDIKSKIKWEIRRKNKHYYKKDSTKKPEKFDSYTENQVDYFALVFGSEEYADGFVLMKNNGNVASKTLPIKYAVEEYKYTCLMINDCPLSFINKDIGIEPPEKKDNTIYLTLDEVGKYYSMSRNQTLKYVENGNIPFPKKFKKSFKNSETLWNFLDIQNHLKNIKHT
tara:strand:+ start:51 stop:758 length:708 start_codon:yes stop_codon:yes gene_type:complete